MSTPPPLPAEPTSGKSGSRAPYVVLGACSLVLLLGAAFWLFGRFPDAKFESPGEQFKSSPVKAQLSQADKDYYVEVSRVALIPTVAMGVEAELFERFEVAGGALDRHPFYATLMNVSAQKITQIPRRDIDRRLVMAAAEYRLLRNDEAPLVLQLQLPDLKAAGVNLALDFLTAVIPDAQGNSKTAEDAIQSTFAKGLVSAADSVKTMAATADVVRKMEMSIKDRHDSLLKELSPEESLGVPSYADSTQSTIAWLEERAQKYAPLLTKDVIIKGLVGKKSPKMDFEFERGEIRELEIVSQVMRGHCIISEIKIRLISSFLQERREAQIKVVHSAISEGPPELLIVE